MRNCIICIVFLFILFGSFSSLRAQPIQEIDSLYRIVLEDPRDTLLLDDFRGVLNRYIDDCTDTCTFYTDELYRLSKEAEYMRGLALALNLQGITLERSDLRAALDKYDQCVEIAKQHNFRDIEANAYNNLSIVYSYMGEYTTSLGYLVKVLQISEERKDSSRIAVALNNIGLRYFELESPNQALLYYFRALEINEKIGRKQRISTNLGNIGGAYYSKGEFDSAFLYYERALAISRELNLKYQMEINHQAMAHLYSKTGNFSKAWKSIDTAMMFAEELGDTYGLITLYSLMGMIHNREKDYAKGKEKYLKALSMAVDNDVRSVLVEAYEGLSESYKGLGDYKNALRYQEKFSALNDSVQRQEKDAAFSQVTQYEKQKNEKEKELLTKNYEIAELSMERQRLLKNMMFVIGGAFLLLAILLFHRYRYVHRTKNQLAEQNIIIQEEKDRSEELLLNILPSETAEELKATGTSEARQFDMVTVLFTDFKDFTLMAEQVTPKELVSEIHYCFRHFDEIISKYPIEKIKTIGDAYMCAGGLPKPNNTNAVDVVSAALEIQQFMVEHRRQRAEEGKETFDIRIGVHTGQVVAGIVGIKKFQYDIWGDTVNIASRMESSGEVGKVNISQSTYSLVKDMFKCKHRGKIMAKNKGEIDMYFVEGPLA
jgi:class 3 adenylate cyclase/Tfp pilus assembly protein PilF